MLKQAHGFISRRAFIALLAIGFAVVAPGAAGQITDADIASFGETDVTEGAEQPALAGETSFSAYMIRLTISLGVVIALIAVVARAGKKYLPAQVSGGRAGSIEVLASRALGGRKNLLLVRVREKIVLLGVGPQSVQFLTDIDETPAAWDQAAARSGLGDLVAVREEPGS